MTDEPGPIPPLNTAAVLRREFAFLTALGYGVESSSTDSVTWRSGERTFGVSRDWRDGYLDTHFSAGRSNGERWSFGLQQALAVTHQEQAWPEHRWQAWKPETVEKYVVELAAIVRDRLSQFLVDADHDWEAAHRLTSDEATAYWNDTRSRQWRSQAESARIAGDWPEVARAYEQLMAAGSTLTEAEAARLRHARHQADTERG